MKNTNPLNPPTKAQPRQYMTTELKPSDLWKMSAKTALKLKGMSADDFAPLLFECVVDGHNGIYSAQVFAEHFCKDDSCGIDSECIDVLKKGPDDPDYIESIDELQHFRAYEGESLYHLHIGESGDYFLFDQNLLELWEALNSKEFQFEG